MMTTSQCGAAAAHRPYSGQAKRTRHNYEISDAEISRTAKQLRSVLHLQHPSLSQAPAMDMPCNLMPLSEESSVSSEEGSFPSRNQKRLARSRSNRSFINTSPCRDCPISIAISSSLSSTDPEKVPSKWFGADVNKFTNGQPGVPNFNPGLRKFIEAHVSKARRMREDRWLSTLKKISSNHCRRSALSIGSNAHIPYPSLRPERSFLFDDETYPLHQILADTIGVKDLSLIHQHEVQDKKVLLKPLLNPESRRAFHECYENFVTSICIPEIHSRAMAENIFNSSSSTRSSGPEEICYRYQAFPCLRVMRPGEFSIGPHCDMAYGHSIGNINFHIPLTPTFGTNALYTETHPGREDWHPLTAKSRGLGYIFDGARCLHFSLENTTERTRVSLDFRIAIYRKSKRIINESNFLTRNYHEDPAAEENDVDDVLCSNRALEDNYSTVPGYYDEFLLDVGASNRRRGQFSSLGSVLRKNNDREGGLLAPDKRVGFPF